MPLFTAKDAAMKGLSRLLASLLSAAMLLVILGAASLLTTLHLLDRHAADLEQSARLPYLRAGDFAEWRQLTRRGLARSHERLEQAEWMRWLVYPGFRHDYALLHQELMRFQEEYSATLDELDALFAENPLVRRGWEEAMLRSGTALDAEGIGRGLIGLIGDLGRTHEVLGHHLELRQRHARLAEEIGKLRDRFEAETGWRQSIERLLLQGD